MSCPLLVTCEWLQERLVKKDRPEVVVIDVSWSSTRDCQQDYLLQHIPSAQYINVLDANHSDVYPRAVPEVQVFAEHARRAGVNPSSHVVVYSNSEVAGFFLAGRGCWTFKYFGHDNVSILDGGLQRWLQLGYPTASGEEVTKTGSFEPVVNDKFRVPIEAVSENQEKHSFQLVDTRPAKQFIESQIPGAVNLNMSLLIDEEKGIMKSPDEIRKLFSDVGVDLTGRVVTHCNSGMSSCTVAMAALLAGATNVGLYHGGFNEWKKREHK